MSAETDLIEKLTTLNHIADTLNRSADVRTMLNDALADLVQLMGLETGWVLTTGQPGEDMGVDKGYVLAAHHHLPPALDPALADVWAPGCACQARCEASCGHEAYNVMQCSRLGSAAGDRGGLSVHASTPLYGHGRGERPLGILNVAGSDWSSFSPQALSVLSNVGSQMGVALERARLFDLLQQRHSHEQEALLGFSNQLLRRSRLHDVMAYLVDNVRQMLRADACALLLPGDEPEILDFQAASGWRVDPVAERRQVPAGGENGPALVMRMGQPLLEEDIEAGGPEAWMPDWLRAEGFRGQAVVPLIAEGRSIGALVLHMRQPGRLDRKDLRLLRLMANQAALAIEKARLHQEEMKGQALERELEVGRQIQLSLLPKATPSIAGWEFAVHYEAARLVGGDFYDFFEPPGRPGCLGMVVADVAGKGVPAALMMALSRTVIRATALDSRQPAGALEQANRVLSKDNESELFITAFFATLDTGSGRLAYANAGHNRPLLRQAATGEVRELAADGIALGVLEEIELEQCQVGVAPGDLLVLYTDGVTEAMDGAGQFFGDDRLRQAVEAVEAASAAQVRDAIVGAVRRFTGDVSPSDDMTVLVVRRST